MQIYRKTRKGFGSSLSRIGLKLILAFFLILVIFFIVDKIDFPSPNKAIKQNIENEKFKVLK